MLLTNINTNFPVTPPTEKEFEQQANKLREIMSQLYFVTDEEFADIKRRVKASVVVKVDMGVAVVDKQQHKSWLPNRRADLDFFFWKRYRKFLEIDKQWNPRIIGTLDRVSDEIIDLLGDPQNKEDFQRRGLVMGDVQSGKTATYTAICNKATDTGYRVLIILAGIQENLRQQTQGRLDSEFLGLRSEHFLNPKRSIETARFGVGKYGKEKRVESFTSVVRDFDKNILTTLNLSLHSVTSTVLFVVKKNKSILNNLINWLQNTTADSGGTIDLPVLLIDDEADNASINTNDADSEPTAINDAIRRLLKLFRQASYLGITATPYANIFIDPDKESEMYGHDLFPRDFVYLLSPPTNYIGADCLFGDGKSNFSNVIQPLYPSELDAFFPFGHKKDLEITELPPSMKEAISYFLLVNGVRDVRGHKEHRSMMIHVSRYTDVQNQIRDLVNEWIIQIRSDLQNYAGLPENVSNQIPSIAELKKVWDKFSLALNVKIDEQPISWFVFLSKYLFRAVAPVNVRAVNQESGATGLDYHNHQSDGLRVIAVGGDSLSRGLTLDGLCVSYFYRRSDMYDTLLQMGRWFGYRPDYSDLFKIWISIDAIDWYGYITNASSELKLEIARMKNENLTPMDFGLKVRQSPDSLLVTAKNKMRSATAIERPITLSARVLETPRLRTDKETLKSNETVFKNFVKQLSQIGQRTTREGATYFWEDVNKTEIVQLLRDFKTHPWHLNFQGFALADFIQNNKTKTLLSWDVVIIEGSGIEYNNLFCGEEQLTIKPVRRAIKATKDQISISGTKVRVGSGGIAKIGLSTEERKQATIKFLSINPKSRSTPDSAYLRVSRPPILMLYVIFVDRENQLSYIENGVFVPEYLYALGIGFPDNGEEKIARYIINTVEFRQYSESD